jgi:hypothetical protein
MNDFSHLLMSLSYTPTDERVPEAMRKAAARVEQLEAALRDIAGLNVPRPVGHTFREDGVASKHDKCWHGEYMYDECGPCLAAHARATLEAKPAGEQEHE